MLTEARQLTINDSQTAETSRAQAVTERQRALWPEANREALDSSNAYVEQHGLPLARFRGF